MTPHLNRRDFLRGTLVTGLALGAGDLLLACGDDNDKKSSGSPTTGSGKKLTKLTAMMPFPLYLAFIAECGAKAGGFMNQVGIDLDLQFARSAPQALQQLAAGNVAVIRNAPIGLVKAVSQQKAPFVSIATANQGIIYTLVSSQSKPVKELTDLPGKTIGLATLAGNAEDTLDLVLKAKGIDPKSVKRQAVGNEAAAFALIDKGRVDALFATREATASMKTAGLDPYVNDLEDTNPLLGTVVVTTRKVLQERRSDLVAYLRGLDNAMKAILDEKQLDALIPKIRDQFDLKQLDDPAKAKPVIAGITSAWLLAGRKNLLRNVPERWETGVEGFKKMKIASADSKATDFYTNDLIDEVLG